MARKFAILGLLLLAVFVPLVVVPVEAFVFAPPAPVARVAPIDRAIAQPLALLAVQLLRAPPSH